MFEGLVRQLIVGYLGRYIKDIHKEQLKITLWNGNILFRHTFSMLVLSYSEFLCLVYEVECTSILHFFFV